MDIMMSAHFPRRGPNIVTLADLRRRDEQVRADLQMKTTQEKNAASTAVIAAFCDTIAYCTARLNKLHMTAEPQCSQEECIAQAQEEKTSACQEIGLVVRSVARTVAMFSSQALCVCTDSVGEQIGTEKSLSIWHWLWLWPVSVLSNAIGVVLTPLSLLVYLVAAGIFELVGLISNSDEKKAYANGFIIEAIPMQVRFAVYNLFGIVYPPGAEQLREELREPLQVDERIQSMEPQEDEQLQPQ